MHSSVVYTAPPTVVTSVQGSTAGSVWQGQSAARDGRGMEVIPGQQQTKIQTTQGATIGHSSDCMVPTLATLRNSADIQAQVNACLQELEQANRTNTAGTGDSSMVVPDLSKKVTGSKGGDKKVSVAWPQDLAFVGTLRKRPQYEDLTQTQWMLGFLRIAQEENNPEFRAHMYEYLTELMQDAADNTWAAAKGAHAILMHRMQDGVLDWGDIKKIQKIRKTYARAIVHSGSDNQTKRGTGNGVPCRNYQTGSCGFPGNHDINGLHVKHICAHCFTSVGKEHKHAKKDCNRLKNVSKNDQK